MRNGRWCAARWRSTAFWALSQNSGEVRNTAPSFKAHFGGYGGATIDGAVDDLDITTEVTCQLPLSHAERKQQFLAKNLTRSGGLSARKNRSTAGLPKLQMA